MQETIGKIQKLHQNQVYTYLELLDSTHIHHKLIT